jgi:hypothetical protein
MKRPVLNWNKLTAEKKCNLLSDGFSHVCEKLRESTARKEDVEIEVNDEDDVETSCFTKSLSRELERYLSSRARLTNQHEVAIEGSVKFYTSNGQRTRLLRKLEEGSLVQVTMKEAFCRSGSVQDNSLRCIVLRLRPSGQYIYFLQVKSRRGDKLVARYVPAEMTPILKG